MADGPIRQIDDEEIALRLMGGEKEGVRMLVEAYAPKVMGFLLKNFEAVAEDALQDAVRNVLRSIDTFDDSHIRLEGWFLTIAKNAAKDILRREKRRREISWDDAPDSGDAGGKISEDDQEIYDPAALDADRKLLSEVLDTLSPMQRKIIMRDAEDPTGKAPAADLAREFETSSSSIRGQRSLAWKAVDAELERRGLPERRKE